MCPQCGTAPTRAWRGDGEVVESAAAGGEPSLVTVPEHPDALVFGRPGSRPFRRATLYTAWHAATKRLGMEGFHIHDLRHTGNTPAAATGGAPRS
jgi:integrase